MSHSSRRCRSTIATATTCSCTPASGPGVALARQAEDDKLGIRQSFLASEQDFGVIVVHGHSASPSPTIRPNRIGIDTGAGNGGKLTCAVFEDDAVAFMSV